MCFIAHLEIQMLITISHMHSVKFCETPLQAPFHDHGYFIPALAGMTDNCFGVIQHIPEQRYCPVITSSMGPLVQKYNTKLLDE